MFNNKGRFPNFCSRQPFGCAVKMTIQETAQTHHENTQIIAEENRHTETHCQNTSRKKNGRSHKTGDGKKNYQKSFPKNRRAQSCGLDENGCKSSAPRASLRAAAAPRNQHRGDCHPRVFVVGTTGLSTRARRGIVGGSRKPA